MRITLLLIMLSCSMFNLYPKEKSAQFKYAETLAWQGKYDEAIKIFDEIIAKDPKNTDAIETKADILSWKGDNKGAIKTYDERLNKEYSWQAGLKKARVLCWTQEYNDAINTYKLAYERSGEKKVELEMLAKKAWWDGHILKSIDLYKELLAIDPKNTEARTDLAEIYASNDMLNDAKKEYKILTAEHEWHFRAKQGLEKIEKRQQSRLYFELPQLFWYRGKSNDYMTDTNAVMMTFNVPSIINDYLQLESGYKLDIFNFTANSSILKHYALMGARLQVAPRFLLDGTYGQTFKASNKLHSKIFNVTALIKPLDLIDLTASIKREDLFNSRAVLFDKLHATDLGVDAKVNINRYLVSYLGYHYLNTNDSNSANKFNIEQRVYAYRAPTELSIGVGLNYQDWKVQSTKYFAPSNFWSVPIIARWRHYLNSDGLYYGAKNTYYGFSYRFQIDKGVNYFNGGSVEFHKDLTRLSGIHFELFGTSARDVYQDLGLLLSFTGYL